MRARKGFTLIELLVTVGVTALLASYMILYGSVSRQQVALSVETAKLAQIVSRAKSLSISTFSDVHSLCGYGVFLNYTDQKYYLRSYEIKPDCRSPYKGDPVQFGAAYTLETYALPAEVRIVNASSNAISNVVFIPPDPKTLTDIQGIVSANTAGAVYLETADGKAQRTMNINPSGQITF